MDVDETNLRFNFDAIFNKHSQQRLLNEIVNDIAFASFLNGTYAVKVITPDRTTFKAVIRRGLSQNSFILKTNRKHAPYVPKSKLLVLLFPLENSITVTQCQVDRIEQSKIYITPLDPRLTKRHRCSTKAELHATSSEIFHYISTSKYEIYRQVWSHSRSAIKASDILKINNTPLDQRYYIDVNSQILGEIKDLSSGGCCIHTSTETGINTIHTSQLAFLRFKLNQQSTDYDFELFVAVRLIRETSRLRVLHCMFLEALPQAVLDKTINTLAS